MLKQINNKNEKLYSLLKESEPFHFIGIAGSGMTPLALVLHKLGIKFSGSDLQTNSFIDSLKKQDVSFYQAHLPQQIEQAKTIVFSSAIKKNNCELQAAIQQKKKILHRAQLLELIAKHYFLITVAGTHGKTTTAGLITHMLQALGQEPSAIIGAALEEPYRTPSLVQKGRSCVIELDESDGSFQNFKPNISVITNIEKDHLDYYGNFENLKKAFVNFIQNLDPNGFLILGHQGKLSEEILRFCPKNKTLTYGFEPFCDIYASNIKFCGPYSSFVIHRNEEKIPCKLKGIGRHNILNTLASFAVGKALDLRQDLITKSFDSFPGMVRRCELTEKSDKLILINDYAHNPGKIRACLQAVRSSWPEHRLLTIYEPHRYSRLVTLYHELVSSFNLCDKVYVAPIFASGEKPLIAFSPERIAQDIAQYSQTKSLSFNDFSRLSSKLKKTPKQKTVILTIGAGKIDKLARMLRE